MGRFRNYKVCDRCGCKIEDEYTSMTMDKVAINGDDHDIIAIVGFDLCYPCGNAVYDFIASNPLPKFGDE